LKEVKTSKTNVPKGSGILEIIRLTEINSKAYTDFLQQSEHTRFFASDEFRRLLKSYTESIDYYFLAIENDEIVGALPSFIKETPLGNCMNSLPYYGSNGGIIEHAGREDVRAALIAEFLNTAKAYNCLTSTIITSPYTQDKSIFAENFAYDYMSKRLCQITEICEKDELMDKYHYKTRNSIRKAEKSNITIQVENDIDSMHFLAEQQTVNMKRIGAVPKEASFFKSVEETLNAGVDYNIINAYLDGHRISSLLLLYNNKTVEYFVPVTVDEFKTYQPMSLIIYFAMQDAWEKGYKYWNWGGTGLTQKSLYDFKKKWGSEDYDYFYYTKIHDKSVLDMKQEDISANFKYFFLVPYEILMNN